MVTLLHVNATHSGVHEQRAPIEFIGLTKVLAMMETKANLIEKQERFCKNIRYVVWFILINHHWSMAIL